MFRGVGPDGRAVLIERFATGLNKPFGLAFYPSGNDPRWLYVGNTDSVVRFPYQRNDAEGARRAGDRRSRPARGRPPARRRPLDARPRLFARRQDALRLGRVALERRRHRRQRGRVSPRRHPGLRYRREERAGLRLGDPQRRRDRRASESGELWASVNERDLLGDNLVPDYITHVEPGGFYGWPWFYIGAHQDPRHAGKHPELAAKVIVPDVLLQPHDASLEMTFYDGAQFPAEYRGDIFAAEHGSWNRKARSGYEVIRVPMHGAARERRVRRLSHRFRDAGGRRLGAPGRRRRREGRRARW